MNQEDHQIVLACSHSGASYAFYATTSDDQKRMFEIGAFKNGCILHYTYENGVFNFVEVLKPKV